MAGFQSPITIRDAIHRISHNEYLLPSFQREYVWSANQVETLFDSLMKGYPISSMLFWRVKGEAKSKYRFYSILRYYIERYHVHNDSFDTNLTNDFWAILDGQQRLTSLYLGLCGSYAYKKLRARWINLEQKFPTRHLYLNISRIFPEDESDKTYNFLFIDKAESQELPLFVDKEGDKWFRVSKILDLYSGDTEDIDDFSDTNELTKEEKKVLRKLEKVICNTHLINYYEEDTTDPDTAVNIFVRINSGGTQLSFSDILMSLATATWKSKDARTEINGLVDQINNLGFNISKDLVLRSFLVLYHKDIRFRIKSFSNVFIEKIEENWESIRDCLYQCFVLLKGMGFNGRTLTSNNAVLPIVFYLYYSGTYTTIANSASLKEERALIKRWLLRSLLFKSFGGSSDQTLARVRKEMLDEENQEDFIKAKSLKSFPEVRLSKVLKHDDYLNEDTLDEILMTQKDQPYAFSILSVLFPHLDYSNIFHLDHMHPATSFDANNVDHSWEIHNSILNLQMLNANENMSKNAEPLDSWVKKELDAGKNKDQFFESHLIPDDVSLDYKDFNNFISARKTLLKRKLQENLISTLPTTNAHT